MTAQQDPAAVKPNYIKQPRASLPGRRTTGNERDGGLIYPGDQIAHHTHCTSVSPQRDHAQQCGVVARSRVGSVAHTFDIRVWEVRGRPYVRPASFSIRIAYQSGQELLAVTGSLMLESVGAAAVVKFPGGVSCAEPVRQVRRIVGIMKSILTAYLSELWIAESTPRAVIDGFRTTGMFV